MVHNTSKANITHTKDREKEKVKDWTKYSVKGQQPNQMWGLNRCGC